MDASIDMRKMKFIERFFRIQDERVIDQFESLLQKQRLIELESEMTTPLTKKQLKMHITQAHDEAKNGSVYDSREVLKRIKKWK